MLRCSTTEKVYYGEGVYETDGQTDLAVDFINKNSKGEKPFALFLSWGPPHDPWTKDNVPRQNYEMFKDVLLPIRRITKIRMINMPTGGAD